MVDLDCGNGRQARYLAKNCDKVIGGFLADANASRAPAPPRWGFAAVG